MPRENDSGFLAAVWHGASDVRLERRQRRPLRSGEVRIAVSYCGICGSDLHEYSNGPHAIPIGKPHRVSGEAAPLVIGHEFSGAVTEAATGVGIAVGTRVAVEPEYRCGSCAACRRGEYNLCVAMGFAGLMGSGGMSEEAVVPAYMLHPLPDSVTDRQAAVLEPAAVALHALRRGRVRAGDTVAVAGAGPIGLLIAQLARIAGARRVVVSDVSETRLAMALDLGATEILNAAGQDLAAVAAGVDVAFEAVGIQSTLDAALASVRKGGRVVFVGLCNGPISLDGFDIVNRELELIASVGYRDIYPDLIGMIASGLFDPSRIVTREIPLANAVTDGLERLRTQSGDVKILINPSAKGDLS
ncbi:2,3-butanediol dehydrogenase [Rhizobium leguminosarum]|uniref:2,3-butanediol dehydrogenase n=1 Tax=Rhizobium leguminosarum TaxID=384 RepID=UPI0006845317|nr:2,3-butanediol dehydrogenase [Rhizobium leguminosarum]